MADLFSRYSRETLPYVREYPRPMPPVEITPPPVIDTYSRPVAVVNNLAPPVSTPVSSGFQLTGTQLLIGAAVLYFLFSKK